jgi:hypothetical protein
LFASFDGIEIPNIASFDSMYEEIGDIDRTAGGNLRQDMTAIKRTWNITTTPITWERASPLVNHYLSYMGAEGDFWFYGQPAPIRATLKINNHPLSQFASRGGWEKNGVTLNITITEV